MRRREFIALTGAAAAAVAVPHISFAQQPTKLPRLVFFEPVALQASAIEALQRGLADHGLTDGQNIALEYQLAPTVADLPAYAAGIAATRPDVVVCYGGSPALAMQQATKTIPILIAGVGDPEGVGLVASLAHPGGNITGISGAMSETASRQVAILRELVPAAKRVAVLYQQSSAANALNADHLRDAAMAQGLEPVMIGLVDTQALAPQFERVLAAGVQAVLNADGPYTIVDNGRDLLWELLVKAKLPAVAQHHFPTGMHPIGGMVSYGADEEELWRQLGEYVDSILKGIKPQDIPVQLPKVFDFALDMKAAKALGIAIPQSILYQATMIIE